MVSSCVSASQKPTASGRAMSNSLVGRGSDRDFEDIYAALCCMSGKLVEIELLGPSHINGSQPTILRDGNAIAIPKPQLVRAFVHARKIFEKHLKREQKQPDDEVWKATSILLLMDPEHLTAVNTRKRILDGRLLAGEDATELLFKEKLLIDSLLTSRLRRHTKSPNLWSHRKWVMQRCRVSHLGATTADDLKSIVFVSAERHPRNYHAWSHARYLINAMGHSDWRQPELEKHAIVMDTKRWCFSHHDDVSGWMFLMFLLKRKPDEASSIMDETLRITDSLRWRNESVWYFLRNMLLEVKMEGRQEAEFRTTWLRLRGRSIDNRAEIGILERARNWIDMFPSTKQPVEGGLASFWTENGGRQGSEMASSGDFSGHLRGEGCSGTSA